MRLVDHVLGLWQEYFPNCFQNFVVVSQRSLSPAAPKTTFKSHFLKLLVSSMSSTCLDMSTDSSIQDVSNFLGRRIAEIVKHNNLNWEEWPGKERMQVLCIRAAGLFIWAT